MMMKDDRAIALAEGFEEGSDEAARARLAPEKEPEV